MRRVHAGQSDLLFFQFSSERHAAPAPVLRARRALPGLRGRVVGACLLRRTVRSTQGVLASHGRLRCPAAGAGSSWRAGATLGPCGCPAPIRRARRARNRACPGPRGADRPRTPSRSRHRPRARRRRRSPSSHAWRRPSDDLRCQPLARALRSGGEGAMPRLQCGDARDSGASRLGLTLFYLHNRVAPSVALHRVAARARLYQGRCLV